MAGIISFVGYDGAVYLMGWTGGYVLLALCLAPYLRKVQVSLRFLISSVSVTIENSTYDSGILCVFNIGSRTLQARCV